MENGGTDVHAHAHVYVYGNVEAGCSFFRLARHATNGLTFYLTGRTLGRMPTQKQQRPDRDALLQGTLDLLILRTLMAGPEHGQGIARAIQQNSSDVLLVEHGSLYPALQRLEAAHLIRAEWGVSSNNRRARFYELTAAGRNQLVHETERWWRMVEAVGRILAPGLAEG
jgi:transcriptional regulator